MVDIRRSLYRQCKGKALEVSGPNHEVEAQKRFECIYLSIHTFCGLATFIICVILPELFGGITLPDGGFNCSWKLCGGETVEKITILRRMKWMNGWKHA